MRLFTETGLQLESAAIIDNLAVVIVNISLELVFKLVPFAALEELTQDLGAFGHKLDLTHRVIAIGDVPGHVHIDAEFLDGRHKAAKHIAIVLVLFIGLDTVK